MTPTSAEQHEALASIVQRLAVLTAAGLPPLSAWRHAAETMVDGLDSAHHLPDRLVAAALESPPHSAWRVLAAIWCTATEAGAALSPTLERTADLLREQARSAREVDVALAGPAATSRIVLALPAFAVLLGWVLGFDMVAAFITPAGAVGAGLGCVLVLLGMRWNRRLLRWAREADPAVGVGHELVCVAMAGGFPPERALEVVGAVCERVGLPAPGDDVASVLAFATRAGVPAGALLRAEADERRRSARAESARRAAVLESRLLLPLGLCVLPAFVLLGVVPIALAIISSTTIPA